MFYHVFSNSVVRKATVTLMLLSLACVGFAGGSGAAPAPGGKSCSVISSFTVASGPAQWGFLYDDVSIAYTLKGCSSGFVPAGTVTVTNLDGPVLGSFYGPSVATSPITSLTGKLRLYGWNLTPYNANVRVDLVVVDPSTGAVVNSQSITIVTPPQSLVAPPNV